MRSPKKKPFSNSRKLSKFKIINWPEYNNILRNRGRIDFMISKNLGENWYEQNKNGKKRSAPEQQKRKQHCNMFYRLDENGKHTFKNKT